MPPADSRFRIWLSATRPRTLPAAVAPVVVATALAWRNGAFDGAAAAICLVFALLVQVGANFANDYFDFVKGADDERRVGPRRAVASGLIAPATMRAATFAVFAAAFAVGLLLLRWGGPILLAVGVACILGGLAYTGGPWPLGYHGLGDLCVFVFFGLVAVIATYFVQAGRVAADAWVVAGAIGLLAANILVVNNYRDAETDARAGKRTLVVILGRGFARIQYAASLAAAFGAPVLLVLRGYSLAVLLPLLLVPLAVLHIRRLRPEAPPAALIDLLGATGRFLALYALLLSAGIALDR